MHDTLESSLKNNRSDLIGVLEFSRAGYQLYRLQKQALQRQRLHAQPVGLEQMCVLPLRRLEKEQRRASQPATRRPPDPMHVVSLEKFGNYSEALVTQLTVSHGGSYCRIQSMRGKSSPRAATSVQSSTPEAARQKSR